MQISLHRFKMCEMRLMEDQIMLTSSKTLNVAIKQALEQIKWHNICINFEIFFCRQNGPAAGQDLCLDRVTNLSFSSP